MKTIMIMDVTAKRADLEKKAIEEKILKEIKKKKMEKDRRSSILIDVVFYSSISLHFERHRSDRPCPERLYA